MSPPAASPSTSLDARSLAKALAALRIFFGLILFTNGLAKLLSFRNVELGPYRSFLIGREEARSILAGEAEKNELPLLPGLVNDVLLPNWEVFQWVVTAVELGVGAALIVGLASRGAALIGLGQQLFLQLLYLSSNPWMWEQPHEWVPLLILVLVPAGRVWGLDQRFAGRGVRRLGGFPF
ncbi:MAG: DoxX family membrane protein [Actinomycetota bacterium]|nr:DoxX family membrane protein [Actinomycetota bacterium]